MIVATAAVISLAATGVSFVVRSETRAIREYIILDRESVKLRLGKMEDQLVKVENVLLVLADYKGQLRLFEERLGAQGTRLDEITRRFNKYSDQILPSRDIDDRTRD